MLYFWCGGQTQNWIRIRWEEFMTLKTFVVLSMSGKGLEVFYMCFLRDQYKGEDQRVQDFWGGCVAVHVMFFWEEFELNVECVLS